MALRRQRRHHRGVPDEEQKIAGHCLELLEQRLANGLNESGHGRLQAIRADLDPHEPLGTGLLGLADEVEGHDAAIPQTGPLPGAYRKSALPVLERWVAAGELGLYRAVKELSVRVVEATEDELRNVNTPADLGA